MKETIRIVRSNWAALWYAEYVPLDLQAALPPELSPVGKLFKGGSSRLPTRYPIQFDRETVAMLIQLKNPSLLVI